MIDKSLRYRYAWGGPGGKSPGTSASGGSRNGGGGGGGRPHEGWSPPAPAPTPAPAPSPHRDPDPAPAPTFDYEGEAYGTPDTIASLTPEPSPHGDRDANIAEQEKLDIQQMIAKQQEEKFGDTADPTRFGETILDIDRVTSIPEGERTIEDKLKIEEWENEQDWEKVEELADRGESFEDIQSAMNKGLLLKEDAIRRQGLIEKGLAALKPTTKLESGLLSNLKSKFDPRSMVGNIAKNFALRKMGLGWLNPLAGLAGLFFPKQTATVKSKFGLGQQPKDMSAFNRLGLLASRQPTDTIRQARVGQGTIGDKIVRGDVDLAKLISGDNRTLVADVSQKDIGRSKERQFKSMDYDLYKMMNPGTKITPFEFKGLQEGTITEPGTYVGAQGGRVDKALGGRVRDI